MNSKPKRKYKKNRKPRSYDEASQAILRMTDKYVCPFCTKSEGRQVVHKIGSKKSEQCVTETARNFSGGYRIESDHWVLRVYNEMTAALKVSGYVFDLLERVPELQSKHDEIEYEVSNQKRIDIRIDYWEDPSKRVEEIRKKAKEVNAKANKRYKSLAERCKAERHPKGLLWREPGDHIRPDMKEGVKIRNRVPNYFYSSSCLWKDGYVVAALFSDSFVTAEKSINELTEYERLMLFDAIENCGHDFDKFEEQLNVEVQS